MQVIVFNKILGLPFFEIDISPLFAHFPALHHIPHVHNPHPRFTTFSQTTSFFWRLATLATPTLSVSPHKDNNLD